MNSTPKTTNWSGFKTAAIVIGAIAILYEARELFIPLAFAVNLALILHPAVNWLSAIRVRRFPAVLLVVTLAILFATGAGYVIFNQLVGVLNELPTYRETIAKKMSSLRSPSESLLGKAAKNVKDLEKQLTPVAEAPGSTHRANTPANPLPVQIVEPPVNGLVYLKDMVGPFLAPLAAVAIVLVFTIFLLVEQQDLRNRLFRLAGLDRLNIMTQALDDATSRVTRYLLLQFVVNSVFGSICAIGLYFIGIPYAALWGAVAAILRLVPYVGILAAGTLPFLLSLAVFDQWTPPLLVFALFTVLELMTGYFVEPVLYGSQTGISSLALLLTSIFWAVLWGPAGLILATPLTVCVVVLGRHVPHLAFLHILLGDQPTLAPDAQIYQRLLAMDDQEAREVMEEYRNENSVLALYDNVILPALSLAEQDRHKGVLEPGREEFLFLSVREMLTEVAEQVQPFRVAQAGDGEFQPLCKGRMFCLAAHDEADEIAAGMLAQFFDRAGCPTILFPLEDHIISALEFVRPDENDVFCISSVPPFAFSHASSFSRKLRDKFPNTRILIGVWGYSGDKDKALQRFQPVLPDKFVTSISEALTYMGVPEAALNILAK